MEWFEGLNRQMLELAVTDALSGGDGPVKVSRSIGGPEGASLADLDRIDATGEALARRMSEVQPGPEGFLGNLWASVKREFYRVACESDERYAELKGRIKESVKMGTTAAVTALSVAIASVLGISAALIAPFISLLLLALMTAGGRAFCETLAAG